MTDTAAPPLTFHWKDLEDRPWRVRVERGWRGLEMTRTYLAQLEIQRDNSRWKPFGAAFFDDEDPTKAVQQVLTMLSNASLHVHPGPNGVWR